MALHRAPPAGRNLYWAHQCVWKVEVEGERKEGLEGRYDVMLRKKGPWAETLTS